MKLSDLARVNDLVKARRDLNTEAEKLAARIKTNAAKLDECDVVIDDALAITTND
jgi:hypothetical protein